MRHAFLPWQSVRFNLSSKIAAFPPGQEARDDNVGRRQDAGYQSQKLSLRDTPEVWRGNPKGGLWSLVFRLWLRHPAKGGALDFQYGANKHT